MINLLDTQVPWRPESNLDLNAPGCATYSAVSSNDSEG